MPLVHIHLRAGRAASVKRAILDGVHAALVEAFSDSRGRPQPARSRAPRGGRGGKAATDMELGFEIDVR